MARHDPYKNFRFRVELSGLQVAGFSEVTGLTIGTDVIEYREGHEPARVRKLPGLHKHANVTLKRGISGSLELYNWHQQIVTGDIASARRTVVIVVADDAGADQVRFVVREAWPVKYDPSDLNAKGNDVLIETLELANEGIERES